MSTKAKLKKDPQFIDFVDQDEEKIKKLFDKYNVEKPRRKRQQLPVKDILEQNLVGRDHKIDLSVYGKLFSRAWSEQDQENENADVAAEQNDNQMMDIQEIYEGNGAQDNEMAQQEKQKYIKGQVTALKFRVWQEINSKLIDNNQKNKQKISED